MGLGDKYIMRHSLLLLGLLFIGRAWAETSDYACGALQNGYGPYDYRTDKDKIGIVIGAHFTPDVANLIKGSSGLIGGDIDYTLRAIPNHPAALLAIIRLGEKQKTNKPSGARYTVECYLNRANRFRNDDPMVKMIYANYLAKNGQGNEALRYLNDAFELGEESANLYYNIGLIYLDLKQYEKSLLNAHRAYKMGFPLPGLRDRLKKAGKWSEPKPISETSPEPKLDHDKEAGEVPSQTTNSGEAR